ncbi:MAG: ABC transporter ATP-binding protein [Bacillota bacterium]
MDNVVVSGLYKSYGSVKAVDGISFTVAAGEIFGMLGPNGAGKSTTMEILIGLRNRDSGDVSVLGHDPQRQPRELKGKIGVQLQTPALYPRLTVREMISLFASFYPHPADVDEVIAMVSLEEKAKVQTKDLSGGQLQRLAIAVAMASNGDVIFLDEPTTGLDPQARRSLWDVILNLKRRGKTLFLTTHYMDEAERLCDRVAVVDHGRIIAEGSPKELIDTHFHEQAVAFVEPALIGDPKLSNLPGVRRVHVEEDCITLYTTEAAQTIAQLMDYTAQKGLEINDITVRRSTLEDVFLKLTGRRIRS